MITIDFIIRVFSILGAVLLFYVLAVYIRNAFAEMKHQPKSWVLEKKKGNIPLPLLRTERSFQDKSRFFSIWLNIHHLVKDHIQGDLAELGVYKGHTAKIIHHSAPDRRLHLFDTFEGFTSNDLDSEEGKARGYSEVNFSNTSIDKVIKHINGNENLIIHKGYFPQSAADTKETQFAFVSIDADLYKPIKAGLEYFYPRLAEGGIIIVHDYNEDWTGAMKAVDEFCRDIEENPLLFPDPGNSIAIIKNKSSGN